MNLEELTSAMTERLSNNESLKTNVKFNFGDDGLICLDGSSSPVNVSNEDLDADSTLR